MTRLHLAIPSMLGLLAAGVGCRVDEPLAGVVDEATTSDTMAAPAAPAGISPLVCSNKRWIGLRNASGKCTPASGWTVAPLIDEPAPAPHGPGDDETVVGDYCVYEWTGANDPALGALPAGLDRDCFANTAQGSAAIIERTVEPALTSAHREQIEMPATRAPNAGARIDVAILDTWARQANPGRSRHGFGMAGIVENLACGAIAGPCPVRVRPFLALDRFGPNHAVDTTLGGHYGTQATLAKAIHEALAAPGATRDVLNISAGWSGEYNKSTAQPGKESHAVRAVLAALREAACSGAIVVAAAGNDTGGPNPPTGPIYPAAFESRSAPACVGAPRPLVWSASAVDATDTPVASTRSGARPILAAPGFAVPVRTATTSSTMVVGPFVGSSVAAADVSAVAAAVWHVDGSLSAAEVMDVVTASAEPLGEPADYCFAPPCGEVKRVSMCRALAMAGAPVTCPTPIAAGTGAHPDLGSLFTSVAQLVDVTASGDGLDVLDDAEVCSIDTLTVGGTHDPASVCPSEILSSAHLGTAVDPQPTKDPCPACMVAIASVYDNVQNPLDEDTVMTVSMPITDAIGAGNEAFPQTLTLSMRGVAVARFDLGNTIDLSGTALGDGLAAGSTYSADLRSETPLTYGVDYNAMSIEWASPASYQSSHPVVVEE